MSDILEKLYAVPETGADPELIEEAAAEIVCLRIELDALKAWRAEIEKQEPAGTLHDDGYFTWKDRGSPEAYRAQFAGWKTPFYLRPMPSVPDK